MNCKPGDLARIVHPSMYGTLVEILYAEPLGEFVLPDGYRAFGRINDGWVFQFLGKPQSVPIYGGGIADGTRNALYAACSDKWLRPIRPGESPKESIEAMRLLTHIPSEVTTS